MLRRALAFLCLLMIVLSAAATPTSALRFKRLPLLGADELSILSLLQDRQGFVWIGTHSGGLYRYDGYQAVRYASEPEDERSLPHDRVSTLFEDRSGRIWAGTQDGLARYNPQTNDFTRFRPPPGPSSQRIIKSIISDGARGMWLATWGGLQHFDPDTGAFRLYTHDPKRPDSLASNDINAVVMDDRGGLWAATWPGGLDYLAPGAEGFVHRRVDRAAAPNPKLNIVRALHFGRDRTLWMGTEAGVMTWSATSDWEGRRQLDAPNTRITYLYADRNDNVWAGTLSAGLLHWNRGSSRTVNYIHRANDIHSLPSDNIRAVMHDRSGMLWVGSFTNGISLVNLNSEGFQRFIPFEVEPNNLRPNNSLQQIVGAPGGKLWISSNSGLSLFDPATGEVLRSYRADQNKPGSLSNDIAYSMYQQPDGPLWVGTSAGLNRLDKPDGPFKVVHFGVGADFINTIAPGIGKRLWLGTGVQVVHYDIDSGKWRNYFADPADPNSRSVNSTTCIIEDKLGRVWMGSEWGGGGLDVLDVANGSFRHFRHQPGKAGGLPDDNVAALYEDPQGRIWAGTSKGLSQVLTGADGSISFRNFNTPGSVGAIKILAMRSDSSGQLWLSTSTGLLRLDPDSGKATRYTTADGLTEGFTVGAALATEEGTLYFGGRKGLTGVLPEPAASSKLYFGGLQGMTGVVPEQVRSISVAPRVAITDVSVFNRSLKDGKERSGATLDGTVTAPRKLTLALQESVFSIAFSSLHYTDPDSNLYAYRLAGFDRAWVETNATKRSATYTNLNPGDYRFEVKAANHQGVWSEEVTSMDVTILPAWWQTWWFRVLAVVLTVGSLALAYRSRVRRLTRRQAELQSLVAARTSELEHSNARLAALSSTDSLTGISNRRGFDDNLAKEWRRAARNDYPLALAMIDVDHFKAYNDHYGHQAGDQCLREVAALIAAHARRTSDQVARYGGEEFTLTVPTLDREHALRVAADVCRDLEQLALPHAKSPYGVVTISIGVAAMVPHEDGNPATLVDAADRALYRAKTEGRNRAVLADGANADVVVT